jgi:hypothetical protein
VGHAVSRGLDEVLACLQGRDITNAVGAKREKQDTAHCILPKKNKTRREDIVFAHAAKMWLSAQLISKTLGIIAARQGH